MSARHHRLPNHDRLIEQLRIGLLTPEELTDDEHTALFGLTFTELKASVRNADPLNKLKGNRVKSTIPEGPQ